MLCIDQLGFNDAYVDINFTSSINIDLSIYKYIQALQDFTPTNLNY